MKTKGFLLTLALVAFIGVADAQNQSKTQKQTNKETATNTQRARLLWIITTMGLAITSKTERHAILRQTAPNDFSMVRAEKMETLPDKETDKDFDETMPKGPIDNRFGLAGGEYF